MEFKLTRGNPVKNQFVLSVGDEGAVLTHFDDGVLANKLYMETVNSEEVKLMEKLTATYPKSPIYILVDVTEQNYSQQVLPPVSSLGIRQQIKRRMKRDFQPTDLNNVLPLGRSKEGRKDWNFLFVSLSNNEPFASWLNLVLNLSNDFKGVYLLPIESMKFISSLNKSTPQLKTHEWELLILHNKTGGFRIVAFKNGKIIFTRLAQNLSGDNLPDIIVGNMEQEIFNTVEYLKRFTFKNEADSKITIIAGADIISRFDAKNLKFGTVEVATPYEAATRLKLVEAVTDKDKFADILLATHFAMTPRHILKFNSQNTAKIENLYNAITGVYAFSFLAIMGLIGTSLYEGYNIYMQNDDIERAKIHLTQAEGRLGDATAKTAKLPANINKLIDIMSIAKMLPEDKYHALRLITQYGGLFTDKKKILSFAYRNDTVKGDKSKKQVFPFTFEIEMNFLIEARDQDLLNTTSESFLSLLSKVEPKFKVIYAQQPKIDKQSQFEPIANLSLPKQAETYTVPAKITINGEFQ